MKLWYYFKNLENWYCWWFKNLANQHSTDRKYQNPVITGGFLPYLFLNQSSSVARQRWKPWCILLCATQRQHSSVACPFGRRPLTAWFLFTCRVGVPCGFQHWHGLFMLLFYVGEGGFSRAMVVKSMIYIYMYIHIYMIRDIFWGETFPYKYSYTFSCHTTKRDEFARVVWEVPANNTPWLSRQKNNCSLAVFGWWGRF